MTPQEVKTKQEKITQKWRSVKKWVMWVQNSSSKEFLLTATKTCIRYSWKHPLELKKYISLMLEPHVVSDILVLWWMWCEEQRGKWDVLYLLVWGPINQKYSPLKNQITWKNHWPDDLNIHCPSAKPPKRQREPVCDCGSRQEKHGGQKSHRYN